MTTPTPSPLPQPMPPRRSAARAWLRALLLLLVLVLVVGAAAAGFLAGRESSPVPFTNPLFLRGLLGRPLDPGLPGNGFWVSAYYVPYDPKSLETLAMRSPHLDQVFSFDHGLQPDGTITGKDPTALFGATSGRKVTLLFANITDDKFSAATARRILTDPDAWQRAVTGMAEKVKTLGAAGAQLDFEDVPAELRPQFSAFTRDLAATLHAGGATLSLAVPAKTADNPKSSWSGAFDYGALAAAADYLVIMAYDEHYRGGDPGPVASLPWTEKVLRYAISVVPTGKLLLGIPGYGYEWTEKKGTSYGIKKMDNHLGEAGVTPQFDRTMGELVAVYRSEDGLHVAWYPNEVSLNAKLQLAQKYNLKGVAMWRLGYEPDSYWDAFAAVRQDR